MMRSNQENIVENKDKKTTRVVVHFPNKLELSMVQANELRHYELFQWLVALLAPISSGFWTAYLTGQTQDRSAGLLWSAGIFTTITILFFDIGDLSPT